MRVWSTAGASTPMQSVLALSHSFWRYSRFCWKKIATAPRSEKDWLRSVEKLQSQLKLFHPTASFLGWLCTIYAARSLTDNPDVLDARVLQPRKDYQRQRRTTQGQYQTLHWTARSAPWQSEVTIKMRMYLDQFSMSALQHPIYIHANPWIYFYDTVHKVKPRRYKSQSGRSPEFACFQTIHYMTHTIYIHIASIKGFFSEYSQDWGVCSLFKTEPWYVPVAHTQVCASFTSCWHEASSDAHYGLPKQNLKPRAVQSARQSCW